MVSHIYTNLPVYVIVRLPHNRSGDSQGQETFLAPSADKQTRNYDIECSNHHLSLSTLRPKGLSRSKMKWWAIYTVYMCVYNYTVYMWIYMCIYMYIQYICAYIIILEYNLCSHTRKSEVFRGDSWKRVLFFKKVHNKNCHFFRVYQSYFVLYCAYWSCKNFSSNIFTFNKRHCCY